jgi:GH24 family phage-related lysozyme (muramidase)
MMDPDSGYSEAHLNNDSFHEHSISNKGLGFIAKNEGKDKPCVYLDSKGNPTAGVGHLLTKEEQETYQVGDEVPSNVRAKWLKDDTESAARAVRRRVTADLSQTQFDSLSDFAYNVGENGLKKSKLARDINANEADPETVSKDFKAWSQGGPGIPARREREAGLYSDGNY